LKGFGLITTEHALSATNDFPRLSALRPVSPGVRRRRHFCPTRPSRRPRILLRRRDFPFVFRHAGPIPEALTGNDGQSRETTACRRRTAPGPPSQDQIEALPQGSRRHRVREQVSELAQQTVSR